MKANIFGSISTRKPSIISVEYKDDEQLYSARKNEKWTIWQEMRLIFNIFTFIEAEKSSVNNIY